MLGILRSLWPRRAQWRNWSLPSKLTALGALLGAVSLIVTVMAYFTPITSKTDSLTEESAARSERLEQTIAEIRSTQVNAPKLNINFTSDNKVLWDTIALIEKTGIKVQATQKHPEEAAMFADENGILTFPSYLREDAEAVRALVEPHMPVPISLVEREGSKGMTLRWYDNRFGLILIAEKPSQSTDRLMKILSERRWVVSVSYDEHLPKLADKPFVISRSRELSAKLMKDLRPLGVVEIRDRGIPDLGAVPVLFWFD